MTTVAFRCDAALEIGTGHLMRCLTLANELRSQGASCIFLCRELPKAPLHLIAQNGHRLFVLPAPSVPPETTPRYRHSHWLPTTPEHDAAQTIGSIADLPKIDCLVVDHYALDASWEMLLWPHVRKIMVIDDLSDRSHACDLLLDQTYGREAADYAHLTPRHCTVICGSQHALLRPEFQRLRPGSLANKAACAQPKRLLLSLGGTDPQQWTLTCLETLALIQEPLDITIVLPAASPAYPAVKSFRSHHQLTLLDFTDNMAQLMADSDVAIGAAGTSTWERACMGLPTLIIQTAENQTTVIKNLKRAGVPLIHENPDQLTLLQGIQLLLSPQRYQEFTQAYTSICDGQGTAQIAQKILAPDQLRDLIVISGTSRGLGKDLIRQLHARDHAIIDISRNPADNSPWDNINWDLAKEDKTAELQQLLARKAFRSLVFINNAATIHPLGKLPELALDEFQAALAINLTTPITIIRSIAAHYPTTPFFIINISTGAAVKAIPGWSAYCITKAAMKMFLDVVAKESPWIHASHVDPGLIDTGMQQAIRHPQNASFSWHRSFCDAAAEERLQKPEDVARHIIREHPLL